MVIVRLCSLLATLTLASTAWASSALGPTSEAKLTAWYAYLSRLEEPTHFGGLVAEAARFHLESPYFHEPQPVEEPTNIDITLESHQCVSLVEQSIAISSCFSRNEKTTACFIKGVENLRYRGGTFKGYASRLHYFVDWYRDNQARGNLAVLNDIHDFRPWRRTFNVMSTKPRRYPLMKLPETRKEIERVEQKLSSSSFEVIPKADVSSTKDKFEHGDIVGIVTHHAGLAVTHVGIAYKVPDGTVRLLHASSFHKRVVITVEDIADYVNRKPKRQGIMVTRPLPLNF